MLVRARAYFDLPLSAQEALLSTSGINDRSSHLTLVFVERETLHGSATNISKVKELIRANATDAVGEYVATELVDNQPTVDQLFGLWVTKDPGGFAADSQNLTDFESTLHDVLLGDPAEELARITGIPDLAGVEFLAQAIPLPGDKTLNSASQYIAVTGIVAGIGTANPVLVYASLKVLAHHELHAAVAAAVRSLINQPTSPPSVREVPATANGNDPISPEPTELGDSGLSPGFSP